MKKLNLMTISIAFSLLLISSSLTFARDVYDAGSYAGHSYSDRDNKLYMFSGSRYIRWDMQTGIMEKGYPREIRIGWPGIPDNIDAAAYGSRNSVSKYQKIYIFKGGLYWRWSVSKHKMDRGYPKKISEGWPGVPNNLDAATFSGSRGPLAYKLYFFKGDMFWCWDLRNDRMDRGYPKKISEGWSEIPNKINAAIYSGEGNLHWHKKLYFSKGNQYWLWDIVPDKLMDGYPVRWTESLKIP